MDKYKFYFNLLGGKTSDVDDVVDDVVNTSVLTYHISVSDLVPISSAITSSSSLTTNLQAKN